MASAPDGRGRWIRTGVTLYLPDGRRFMLLSTSVDESVARIMWLSPDHGRHDNVHITFLDYATESPQ